MSNNKNPGRPTNPRNLRVVDPQHAPRRPAPASAPERSGDIRRTKEYKAAARRWTSAIVALPIALYTSYILYDRTYGGQRTVKEKRLGENANTNGQDGQGQGDG